MTDMRFDGQVAVVTGAGGNPGLGRAHAMLLASRGAKVVVNDLGVGPDGSGAIPADPAAVVAEIVAAGGEAVADLHSVADEQGAQGVVQTALDTWGRVDILVNNAGIGVVSDFDEIEPSHLEKVLAVHLMGHIWMCRAAWPHMKRAGYGRIVNTTSGGMWGMAGLTVYGAAKFGIYGLTRGLALEGAPHGIRVNAVSPGGHTNSFDRFYEIKDPTFAAAFGEAQPAALVSPMVGYLAHESCELTGGLFDSSGGMVQARIFGTTPGFSSRTLTIEDIREHLDELLDVDHLTIATDPRDAGQAGIAEVVKILEAKPYQPL
ncbi:MAG TPA: SDR family NAD(P)-dependent oxidoreductase [Candidatus Limnocylindrales bacterium]